MREGPSRRAFGSCVVATDICWLGGLQEEGVEADGSLGWGAAGHAQVGEDLADHGRVFDGRDDRQGPAILGTVSQVKSKHPFEE